MSRMASVRVALLMLLAGTLAGVLVPPSPSNGAEVRPDGRIPLIDLANGAYHQFTGGLYADGSNIVPPEHAAVGLVRAKNVQPVDGTGNPSHTGKYILLSIGMSNTSQEFCSDRGIPPCHPFSFMGQAAADPTVNTTTLVIVNGAKGGRAAEAWVSPRSPEYDRIRDTLLAPLGLNEQQVQVVWLKVANPRPRISLPLAQADAYVLEAEIANILRALKVRYPHLQQVFISSRTYGGYARTELNPEPYAYESGFAVKWVIRAQIEQMRAGGPGTDARAGDLNYAAIAPWVAWGPYLWANGTTPRSDGLSWDQADFRTDGTHPSIAGVQKVGTMLLSFLKNSPFTKCWAVIRVNNCH